MLKIKGQRGFFVFSDPAGAKACLALVKSFQNKEIPRGTLTKIQINEILKTL